MRQEIETELDIDAISDEWDQENAASSPPIIERIEDVPHLEDVSGANIEWILDGIPAKGALHMFTSEPGGGKSTLMSSAAYAVSLGQEFMGRATSKRPVLLLDAENPYPAIRERFGRLGIRTHDDFRGQWVDFIRQQKNPGCEWVVIDPGR
jgi:hypothetical protein